MQKLIPDAISYVEVAWSAMCFSLALAKGTFDTDGPNLVDGGKHYVGVFTTSPVMAKVLARDLAAAVEAYERQYGPIPTPPLNANVVPLRPVDPPQPGRPYPLCPHGSAADEHCVQCTGEKEELRQRAKRTGPAALYLVASDPLALPVCRYCAMDKGDLHAPDCEWEGCVY